MQLQLPKIEELAALQPEKGVFTVLTRVRAHREVSKLTLIVRTNKAGTLGRHTVQAKNYVLKPMIKGQTQYIAIKIPAQENDGIYRIAAALRIEQKGKAGVVSKGVFIQVVENGQPSLKTIAELRRTQISKKNKHSRKPWLRNSPIFGC